VIEGTTAQANCFTAAMSACGRDIPTVLRDSAFGGGDLLPFVSSFGLRSETFDFLSFG
jgi:hypothetical protein